MSMCPECTADLTWYGGTSRTPETVESMYECPDPDCRVVLVRMVIDE